MTTLESEIIKNKAAGAGLVLGAVSGAYIFVEQLIGSFHTPLAGLAGMLLWAGKLVACIMLMKRFMVKLCIEYPEASMFDTRRLGNWIAVFSGIITAAASYVALQYVFPDAIKESMDMLYKAYGSQFDSNTKDALQKIESDMPLISLVSTFIWCLIYGYVLSGILSRRVPGFDPFALDQSDNDVNEN